MSSAALSSPPSPRPAGGLKEARTVIAVSLKMYFDPARTVAWCGEVADLAATHEAVTSRRTHLVVLPSLPAMSRVAEIFVGTNVALGAQDLFYEDRGPYTGGVSGADLRDIGCLYAEVGHAERRNVFHETDEDIRLKVGAAWRNGLTPLVCVGESTPRSSESAAHECIAQLELALGGADDPANPRPLLVAYEPTWAIGAAEPADSTHVAEVASRLRAWLEAQSTLESARLLYGGSAGVGLLAQLGASTDGLFLGRFAHDPRSLRTVLDETLRRL